MSAGAMARFVKRKGEDWIYTGFTAGARDGYEDEAQTADATPPTIRGIRSDGKERHFRDETGEERLVDIAVLVASSVVISDVQDERARTLTDSSGRIYKIIGIGHEAATPVGARRLLCVRQSA